MKRLFSAIIFIFISAFAGMNAMAGPEESIGYASLNVSDGLSQISVLDIMQDSKGFMWFATRNGLNRYDGMDFKVFRKNYDGPGGMSENHTLCIAEDHDGHIWAGTMCGLNRIDLSTGETVIYSAETGHPEFNKTIVALACRKDGKMLIGADDGLYLQEDDDSFRCISKGGPLEGIAIFGIEQLDNGDILVSTETDGLFVYASDFSSFRHYHHASGSLPTDNAGRTYKDSRGTIWLGSSSDGMVRFNPADGSWRLYDKSNSGLSTNNVRCFSDDGHTLYIGTMEGIFFMDISGDGPISFEKNNLSNFSVYSIMQDRSGTRWVGTYSGGVNYYHPSLDRMPLLCPKAPDQDYPSIFGAMAASEEKLYVATEGSGLLEYDLQTKESRYYQISGTRLQHGSNIIKSVAYHEGLLYCGTGKGEIYTLNPATRQFRKYLQLDASSVYSIVPEDDGTLWIGTSRDSLGLVKVRDGKIVTFRFTKDRLTVPTSRVIRMLDDRSLLVGTRRKGLIRYYEDRDSLVVAGGQVLNGAYVTSICRDGDTDNYYIGTYGQGLYSYDAPSDRLRRVRLSLESPSAEIYQIVQDSDGTLWISTHRGIVKYNPKTDAQTLIRRSSDVDIQEFSLHSGTFSPSGYLAFSGSNGFVIFRPEDIAVNTFVPPLAFTGITINNEDRSHLGIDDMKSLSLRYNENNISISFAALSYISPENNRYVYRLKGVDQDWTRAASRHSAHYANLAPGRYRFEVKCSNNDGIWNDEARSLDIYIQPPFWKRWWAKVIYVLLLLGAAVTVMYYIIYKNKLEQSLVFEQQKQKQIEEFHQSKLRMFTNLSHELRTPLLLIMSPLKELTRQLELAPQAQNKIKLIQDNSQRLLTLVNQLMDLQKNESGQMKIKVEKDDIVAYLKEIYVAFNQLAMPKGIELSFNYSKETIQAIIDKSAIEKVMFNLLSNAIKFTPAGGNVALSVDEIANTDAQDRLGHSIKALRQETPLIHIQVSDNGKGIPEEDIKDIFTAFYQVEDGKSQEIQGTGIGLSLTESLVLLHHGLIWVESAAGKGATFNILIPNDISAYKEEETGSGSPLDKVGNVIPPSEDKNLQPQGDKKYTILLVEDNNEVRGYVRQYLVPYYNVMEANNGQTAYDLAVSMTPSLILSDIMMPVKDGLELCADIKKDNRTAHIPVILMTARSMVMQIKEGFASGADDYIIKPFDMDLLLYRIRNLLHSRDKLRNIYGKSFSPEALGIEVMAENDRFTNKFFEVVEKNIDNPDLDIQMICDEIGLSRANLYRKLKAISSLSPMELVRNKRLEIAAKLLVESDYSISEIANYTGFSSHPYFTSCFKNQYGQTPSEYIETHRSQKS